MHKIQKSQNQAYSLRNSKKPSYLYPTRFSHLIHAKTILKLNKCKYGISYRGPFILNNFLSATDKQTIDIAKFKTVTKSKLLLHLLKHILLLQLVYMLGIKY